MSHEEPTDASHGKMPSELPEPQSKAAIVCNQASTRERDLLKTRYPSRLFLDERSEDSAAGSRWRSRAIEMCCLPTTARFTCRPVVKPNASVWSLCFLAFLFFLISIVLTVSSPGYVECTVPYPSPIYLDRTTKDYQRQMRMDSVNYSWITLGSGMECHNGNDCYREDIVAVPPDFCTGLGYPSELIGSINVYYELEPFYQNHRSFVYSRSNAQLTGSAKSSPQIPGCAPLSSLHDLERVLGRDYLTSEYSRFNPLPPDLHSDWKQVELYPCGIQSVSVFNDTFELHSVLPGSTNPGPVIPLDTTAKSISLTSDTKQMRNRTGPLARNESGTVVEYRWLPERLFPEGINSAHFINWMRLSSTSRVRKLWGTVTKPPDGRTQLPLLVRVKNRYDLSTFNGDKRIVITQVTILGPFSAASSKFYAIYGALIVIFAGIFFLKLRLRPRVVGDIHLLYKRDQFASRRE